MVRGDLGDGRQGLFIFDTGAERTVFDASDAKAWGVPIEPLPEALTAQGTGGGNAVTHQACIARIGFAEFELKNVTAPLLNLHRITKDLSGYIGCDLLRGRVILFDGRARKVHILLASRAEEARTDLFPGRTWSPVPFQWWQGCVPVVSLKVAGKGRISLLVDTGASRSSVPAALAKRLNLLEAQGEYTHVSGVGGTTKVKFHELEGLIWGRWNCAAVTHEKERPWGGILGYDILGRVPFVLDGPARKLWVLDPPEGEAATIDLRPKQAPPK